MEGTYFVLITLLLLAGVVTMEIRAGGPGRGLGSPSRAVLVGERSSVTSEACGCAAQHPDSRTKKPCLRCLTRQTFPPSTN